MAHDSQIVRAKENLKLSYGGPSQGQASGTNQSHYTDYIIEPWHEISNNVACATSKASDQPVHMRSLIRAFASRLNILWLLSYWPNIICSF